MQDHLFFKNRLIEKEVLDVIRSNSLELHELNDLEPLLNNLRNTRIVMLGEASHGTHEYYTWRSYITKKLIDTGEFNFIAVEGDWPDCYQINEFIKNENSRTDNAQDVLGTFRRWPTWMWANREIEALTVWLKEYNNRFKNHQVGFYGLDVYSLWESLDSIVNYLQEYDPAALEMAKQAFNCFEPYRSGDGSSYARATRLIPELCENEVIDLLKEMQKKSGLKQGSREQVFNAEQNALIAVNAEKYYRAMISGGPDSWNLRDSHMMDTLDRLLDFSGTHSKAIVWAHNTHIGDSSATDMSEEGMYNIGELARFRYKKEDVYLVGFGSYAGTVVAGENWGEKMEVMQMPEARSGSWEHLLHKAGSCNRLLFMNELKGTAFESEKIGHRAIGVVYKPEFEKYGNYVPSNMVKRYDAFIHIDQTKALHALQLVADKTAFPDTYPSGL